MSSSSLGKLGDCSGFCQTLTWCLHATARRSPSVETCTDNLKISCWCSIRTACHQWRSRTSLTETLWIEGKTPLRFC
ncbi:hypothetical protein PHYPO_G00065880 [Pangasianodon hypophthalmus]|uniref:Uncharacterized protein n=1 Tax=Pangasianodon hypophthalmus TaxID=310915 RepID=A0A5N5M2W3_PANHP|nr:hypothetical protein PHYPO_G00065880 [Pangasianodon hypophthalmus]